MLFNVQSVRIQHQLSQYFEFIFPDGPFETAAGPGVLPFFEGCEPFYSWIRQKDAPLLPESKAVIEKTIKGREHEFVGIMGFSQGARFGAGLLLEQQLRSKEKRNGEGEEKESVGFKFGVFLMGTSPPLISGTFSKEEGEEIVRIPSVHFVGTQDPYLPEGEKLFEHFDEERSSLVQLDVGHRLPNLAGDTMKVVNAFKMLYRQTTGKELVDLDTK